MIIDKVFFTNAKQDSRPNVPPPNTQQNNAAQPIDAANYAPVCYYHQTFGDKARTCRDPCTFFLKLVGRSKVATLASGKITETRHDYAEATIPTLSPSKLLYVADKRNKCKYLIDTGAAVSVLYLSLALTGLQTLSVCPSLQLIKLLSIPSKRIVNVGLKREYAWTFIIADNKQPIIGADFFIHYRLLVDLKSRCVRDMRTGLAIPATLSSIKHLSLNRVDTVRNKYTKLLGQF